MQSEIIPLKKLSCKEIVAPDSKNRNNILNKNIDCFYMPPQ